MRKLWGLRPVPDGVFWCNDPVAAEAIRAVREAGLRGPEVVDLAVIGSGNLHYSDLLRLPLSAIESNGTEIERRAAGLL